MVGICCPREGLSVRLRAVHRDESGSSAVEFVLVGALLTVLTLAVLQLGLIVYVRNVVHDAAVEGAFHAALADTTLDEGVERTSQIVERTVGAQYASDVSIREMDAANQREIEVTVRTTLPMVGLLGLPRAMEVSARAPVETLE